jgi:hypothetical protein
VGEGGGHGIYCKREGRVGGPSVKVGVTSEQRQAARDA